MSSTPPVPDAPSTEAPAPASPSSGAYSGFSTSPFQKVDWSAALRTDWMGPTRVAAVILATSGVLAVLLGLGMRPAVPGLQWTVRTTLVFFGWLWSSAFGADLTGKASAFGVDAGAGAGTFALTITILSLGAGAWLFRRYTRGLTRASSVAWFAVRAAVLTAIPPTIVSWVLYADLGDLLHLAGQDRSVLEDLGVNIGHLKVGFSSVGSFFLTLLLTAVVLLATAAVRADLLSGPAERVRGFLAGPILGAGVLLAALIPLALLAEVLIWVFHLGNDGGTDLTWHQWMNIAAAAIAFAPNVALWELGLGSGGQIHAAASTSFGSASVSNDTGLSYWTGSDGLNNGVWFALVLAPVLLATTAYLVVRLSARRGAAEQRTRLAAWVVSLVVVLPVLFHWAGVHAHASGDGLRKASGAANAFFSSLLGEVGGVVEGVGIVPNTVRGDATAGPGTLAVLLVLVYAIVIAVIVALATGIMRRDDLTALRGRLRYQPAGADTAASTGASEQPPVTYAVGDVVNGWRWTGSEWVPADS